MKIPFTNPNKDMPVQEMEIDVGGIEEPNIAPLNSSVALAASVAYAREGTAHALDVLMTDPATGDKLDILQVNAGSYSSIVIGSSALARTIIPPLEKSGAVDVAAGREYQATTQLLGVSTSDGLTYPGVSTMPMHGAPEPLSEWSELRKVVRGGLKGDTDQEAVAEDTAASIERLQRSDGTFDLSLAAYSTAVRQILNGNLGGDVGVDEAIKLAEIGALQERIMPEGFVTLMSGPVKSRLARGYEEMVSQAGIIIEQKVLSSGSDFATDLLHHSGGSHEAAQTQVVHAILGARAISTAVYWGLKSVFDDRDRLDHLRHEGTDEDFDSLARESIARYPGAFITSRTPEDGPVNLSLVSEGQPSAQLKVGSKGRVALSTYLWGQNYAPESQGTRSSFGVGRRRCPGEKASLGITPAIMKTVIQSKELVFPDTKPSGYGTVLSPKPDSRVTGLDAVVDVSLEPATN